MSADAIRAVDPSEQLDSVLALPDHLRDALWRIESARLEPIEAPTTMRLRDGRLGDRRRPRRRRARRPRWRGRCVTARGYELPLVARPTRWSLCSSYSGDTEETLACYEAAEALGATPDRRHHRRQARRVGARRRRAGHRPAGRACSRAPRSATCSRSPPRSAALAGGAERDPHRDRQLRRRTSRAPRRRSASRPASSPAGSTDARPGRLRRGLTAPGRLPLEVPDQRERASCPRSAPSCPRPTTTRSPAGRGPGSAALSVRLARGSRPASARAQALRADREADRAPRRADRPGRDRGRDPHRARCSGR